MHRRLRSTRGSLKLPTVVPPRPSLPSILLGALARIWIVLVVLLGGFTSGPSSPDRALVLVPVAEPQGSSSSALNDEGDPWSSVVTRRATDAFECSHLADDDHSGFSSPAEGDAVAPQPTEVGQRIDAIRYGVAPPRDTAFTPSFQHSRAARAPPTAV